MHFFDNLNDPLYQTFALVGAFIVFFGLVSLFVKEKMYLTEALAATIFGIVFGPVAAGLITPEKWFGAYFYRVIQELSRVVISMQVMAVGISTPRKFLVTAWRDIAYFLGPIMVVMWGVGALCVKIMGFSWLESLIIGACLAPTDPVLAHSVIKGKFANRYIPGHLRLLLAVESGANDGLGFPFLMLPVLLLKKATASNALGEWFLHTWIYEIFLSIVVGFAVGWSARFALERSEKLKLIDKESFLVYTIALGFLTTGLVAIIASDDLLAVFIAGNAFSWDERFLQETKDSHLQEVLDMLFNVTYFIFFGASIPWQQMQQFDAWRLFLTGFCILLFRRLPITLALKRAIPQLMSYKEAFFAGWFGPMGVGAIFFSMVIITMDDPDEKLTEIKKIIFPMVSFVVLCSLIVHGITVPITHFHLKSRLKRQMRLAKTAKVEDSSPPLQSSLSRKASAVTEKEQFQKKDNNLENDIESSKVEELPRVSYEDENQNTIDSFMLNEYLRKQSMLKDGKDGLDFFYPPPSKDTLQEENENLHAFSESDEDDDYPFSNDCYNDAEQKSEECNNNSNDRNIKSVVFDIPLDSIRKD